MAGNRIGVTASEMMEMRKSGMSNRDIANSLDICLATVRKYIGNQGCRMTSFEAFRDTPPKKKVKEATPVEIPKYEPKPSLERYRIADKVIELNAVERDVEISDDSGLIFCKYESIPELVQFLVWAMRERMEVTADGQTDKVQEHKAVD